MGVFKKLFRLADELVSGLERKKILYSEKKAIRKKKPIYSKVQWTESQMQEFDDFWLKSYGKKFPPHWNKLYESANGHYTYAYFPEMLYTAYLEPKINPTQYCEVISDKNMLTTLFEAEPMLRTPKTYFSCTNGVLQNGKREIVTYEQMLTELSDLGDAVIKPTVDTGSGRAVSVVHLQNCVDTRSNVPVKELLRNFGKNYVIQERIVPCKELKKLSPNCVSTIRLMTFIANDDMHHVPLVLRVGTGKSDVDNIHAGGLCVGIYDDGRLKKKAYRLGYGDQSDIFLEHPDSKIVFEDYLLPSIPEMIEAACRIHKRVVQLGMISWDFTIDERNEVVLIEANCKDQSVWFPQIVNECPLFGEHTAYMLNLIKKG